MPFGLLDLIIAFKYFMNENYEILIANNMWVCKFYEEFFNSFDTNWF